MKRPYNSDFYDYLIIAITFILIVLGYFKQNS
jgi:hypothetical protein